MRTIGTVLLLAAVACTTARSYCRTRCGMALLAPSACEPFQAQEDVALHTFEQRGIFPYARSCRALDGYAVGVRLDSADAGLSELVFIDAWGRKVAGETNCDLRRIGVTNARWHSQSNALTHEMVHAIEGCPTGPRGEDHYRWFERGIPDAIEAARPEP